MRVLDHGDFGTVAAVDGEPEELQMGQVAGQHEPRPRIGGLKPVGAAAVDVVVGGALQPVIGDHREVLDDGAAPQRQERHRQTGTRDQDPAEPHPSRMVGVEDLRQRQPGGDHQQQLRGGHAEQPAPGLPRPEPDLAGHDSSPPGGSAFGDGGAGLSETTVPGMTNGGPAGGTDGRAAPGLGV